MARRLCAVVRQTSHLLFDLICWISSGLTTCVRDRPCFAVFLMKIEQNSCVSVIGKFNAFLGYWRFMQIRQRIFNCTEMQITYFILDKRLKLLTYYTPFYHQSLRSCDLKNSPFFGPPCRYQNQICLHPSLCLLVSRARWEWPLMWLTNSRPWVLYRRCWLGHLTRKIVS